jgi:hypothetical protein
MISKQKNPVEKPKKSVEKTKKPVEKTKKPVEKTKKPVEKPKKSVPRKRVKNVNVDKIVKIIKKCVIKCGFKNPKLKGGKLPEFISKSYDKLLTLTGKKKSIEKNICCKNLKILEELLESISKDILEAKKDLHENILSNPNFQAENTVLADLANNYKDYIDSTITALAPPLFSWQIITDENMIMKFIGIEKYLIVCAIDIVKTLTNIYTRLNACCEFNSISPSNALEGNVDGPSNAFDGNVDGLEVAV